MKYLLYIALLFAFNVHAQNMVVVSKVTRDSVAIKWVAADFNQLELLSKGATISRVETDKPINFELVNFTGAKTWTIAPTKDRFDQLGTSEEDEKFKTLLEPILNSNGNKDQEDFAMLTATVENMVNPRFQYVLGNILVDKNFDKSKTYVYKIEIDKLAPNYVFVDASEITSYSSIPEFELSLDRRRTVMVEWNSNAVEKEALGFLVEHSMDKQIEGTYLSDLPYIPFKSQFEKEDKKANVIDNPEPGHWHYYRVHGLDPFGYPSLTSEWKRIYVPLLVNAHVQIDTIIANDTERKIQVSASSYAGKLRIDNWALLRSESKDSGYEIVETQLFSDSIQHFSTYGKSSGDHFYYKIQAINQDDTVTSLPYYFFTLDQVPPTPPTELQGKIDSSGVVQLSWIASIDDDIRGYKVYRGNQKREEFVEQTTRLSTNLSYTDTLALDNLTSEVYYFVKSIDLNFNVSSESDTLLLLKPDTIPPMSAALKSVGMVDDEVMLITWANSDSEDLAHSFLIRNEVDTVMLAKDQVAYADSALIPGNYYSYQILCEDKSGNQSRSQTIQQYYETGFRYPLEAFKAEVNREENLVSLSWNAPDDEVYSYQLFRAKNDGKLGLIETIDPSKKNYIDKRLSIGNKYTYSIKYVNQDGIHSIPSTTEIIY
jgi:hypothetical protein